MNTPLPTILFHTACDPAYEDFIPVFALSVLINIPDSKVEIGVKDAYELPEYLKPYKDRLHIYKYHCPEGVNASTIRYINNVTTKADYVYISDIDFVILDPNLVQTHLDRMKETGLPYCNGFREESRALTGLHFTKYDAYYPVDYDGIDIVNLQDEQALYQMVRKRIGRIPMDFFRPVHGIHISPSRTITGEPGWCCFDWFKPLWAAWYEKVRGFLFSERVTDAFKQINEYYANT
jgi:hypothetical protein